MTRLLCRLLWLANSDPPSIHRQRFYAMKHAMLRRFAEREGRDDIQTVTKPCWTCDGTGVYPDSGRECRKCWGSGAYSRRSWRLARWRWHGRVFHVPEREEFGVLPSEVTIRGRIDHEHRRDLGRKPAEAALWLALLFDRGLFWRLMTGGCCCGWTGFPLLTLNQAVFAVAMHWERAMRRFRQRRHRWAELRSWDWTDDVPF